MEIEVGTLEIDKGFLYFGTHYKVFGLSRRNKIMAIDYQGNMVGFEPKTIVIGVN